MSSDSRFALNQPTEILLKFKEAVLCVEHSQIKDALRICAEILQNLPDHEDTLRLFIECAYQTDVLEQVYPVLEDIFSSRETTQRTIFLKGQLFGSCGKAEYVIARCNERIANDVFALSSYHEAAGAFEADDRKPMADLSLKMAEVLELVLKNKGQLDYRQELAKFDAQSPKQDRSDETICFVAGIMSARMLKLAFGLKNNGAMVMLLLPLHVTLTEDQKALFHLIIPIKSPMDLSEVIASSSPQVIHVFAGADAGYAEALACLLISPEKVVLDMYDLADPNMSPLSRLEEGSELWQRSCNHSYIFRYLMNHYPAICGRALYSKLQVSQLPGGKIAQKRIYLPELAWGNQPHQTKLSDSDGELHVVHGGTVLIESAYRSKWDFLLWLAEKADELEVHFHYFAMAWGEGGMEAYEKLDRDSEYFHLHPALSYKDWLSELGRYDVGLYFAHAPDVEREGNIPRNIDPSGTWANKFGDYLDAGLYALTPPAAKALSFATKRYGIGETIDLDRIFTKNFWDELKNRLLSNEIDFEPMQQILSAFQSCKRLQRFYGLINSD